MKDVKGDCPCGGTYKIFLSPEKPASQHSIPPCEIFVEYDLPGYMNYVRTKVLLKVLPDLSGAIHVGYDRTDSPLIHTIIRAFPGDRFTPGNHWPCIICEHHGLVVEDFHAQWPMASAAYDRRLKSERSSN